MEDFGKIGVLLGGPSSEREISILSGNAVYGVFKGLGYDTVRIELKDARTAKENILKEDIDDAFIALHGRFGEDGTIQTMLEQMNVPYTGSGPEASRLALNKALAKKIFKDKGLPTPRYEVLKKHLNNNAIIDNFGFPFIVKPANEGSSIGMSIVDKKSEVKKALDEAFAYDEEVVMEEYIPGEDITVGILDDEPLPVVHIKPKEKFYNYKAKYTKGMSEYIVPADFDISIIAQAQGLGLLAHRCLGCRYFSRVDMLVDERDKSVVVLEVNTIPGFTSSSLLPKAAQAKGIDFAEMCACMIRSALIGV